jgi:hypothetical protein
MPLLVTLVFWLIAIFVSFGLFAPRNAAVIICMFISAASVSGAILMILEMYAPYRDSCSFQALLCAQLLRSSVDRAGSDPRKQLALLLFVIKHRNAPLGVN